MSINKYEIYRDIRIGMQKKENVNSSGPYMFLLIFALASSFFPRVLTAMGFPSIVIFIHYGIVFLGMCVMLIRQQTITSAKLLFGLFLFLVAIFISKITNKAGIINLLLEYLILAEPIMFLYLMTNKRWSEKHIGQFRRWIFIFIIINAVFAFFQRIALRLTGDDVQGVFIGGGQGHHVSGAVALSACVYFLSQQYIRSRLLRYTLLIVLILVDLFADNKQSILVFIVSLIVMLVLNLNKLKSVFRYFIITIISIGILYLLATTFFPAFFAWANANKILLGINHKFSVFQIIHSYKESFLNVLFGYGPGHTVGKLGFMLPEYYSLLKDWGATISPITGNIWSIQQEHWLTNTITGSSMWSLFFSWAGIWGDLGYVGLYVYLAIWFIVYRKICIDNTSKYLLITIVIHGLVTQWIEESAYVLYVMSLIGLRFQENYASQKKMSYKMIRKSA